MRHRRVRTFTLLAFAFAIVVALTGCGTIVAGERQEHVEANVFEASRQLDLGNDAAARTWLDRAIAFAPNSLSTYDGFEDGGVGGVYWCLEQHHDLPDLVTYLGKAVANPKLSAEWQLWQELGQAYTDLGQKAAAQDAYKRELGIIGGGATVARGTILTPVAPGGLFMERAEAEWGAGEQAQARADFKSFITRYPQNASEAQNDLAYNEALANVDLPEAFALSDAAVKAARAAGETDDVIGEFVDTRAWVEYRLGRYSDASVDENEAVADDPAEPVLHYHLAMIYRALGDNADARIEIERSDALCPSNPDTRVAMRLIDASPPEPQSAAGTKKA